MTGKITDAMLVSICDISTQPCEGTKHAKVPGDEKSARVRIKQLK
jgi:hypothetical protein